MREAILQLGAHRRIVADQVARNQQQVQEVQAPRAALQVFVDTDDRPQLVAQERREIRARIVAKLLQPLMQFGAAPENLLARHLAKAAAVSLPIPAPPGAKRDQHRLERVVVAPAHRLQPRRLGNRLRDRVEAPRQPVVGLSEFGKFAQRFDLRDDRVDLGVALEWRMPPRRIEVPPVQQLERRAARDRARSRALRQIAPPQQAAHSLARIVQHPLEPSFERGVEHLARNVLGRDFEHRIDPRFHRPLPQQVGAKRMNRSYACFFELLERLVEAQPRFAQKFGAMARTFDFAAQPQLQLAGRLLGERHRDDPRQLAAPRSDHRHDSIHQRRGLARTGGGLDYERDAEVVANPIAHRLVGYDGIGHGVSASRAAGSAARAALSV